MNTENSTPFQFKTEEELRAFIAYNSYSEIKKYKDDLLKHLNSLYDIRNKINYSVNELENYDIKCNTISYDNVINTINEEIKPLQEHSKLIKKYLEEKQRYCDHHDWIYYVHDSHYDYYKCSKCGAESKD